MSIQYPEIITLDEDDLQFFRLLNVADEKIRFIALMNVADEEREVLLPWLHYALLHDPSELLRTEAAKRLEGWEDELSLNALATALEDPSETVIQAATHSLSEVKILASADILAGNLAKDSVAVKVAILGALKPLRAKKYYLQILDHTKHDSDKVRREAVSALSWLQLEDAVDVLADISQKDQDIETRRIATGGLAYTKNISQHVIDALKSSIRTDDWQLRLEAGLTIGKLKVKQLEDDLLELLFDPYWQVRIAIVRSLGLLKSQKAVDGLAENFNHDISNLRKEIALALGDIASPEALKLLLEHENDADPEVRKSIRISLNQIRETLL